MDISISEIGNWKRCPKMEELAGFSFRGLSPVAPSLKMDVGSAVHAALAAQSYGADPETFLRDHWFPKRRAELYAKYRSIVGLEPNLSEQGEIAATEVQALGCVRRYFERYGPEPLNNYVLLAAEVPCRVPIPDTDGHLILLLDGLASHRDRPEEIAVLERKTYGRRPTRDQIEDQDQFVGYTWACRVLFGVTPRMLYDGIARQPPKTSKIMYPEGQDKHFTRWPFDYDDKKLYNFQCELTAVYTMIQKFAAGEIPVWHNFRRDGCWDCSVTKLCKAQYRGEDWEFIAQRKFARGEPPNRQAQRLAEEGLVTTFQDAHKVLTTWRSTLATA